MRTNANRRRMTVESIMSESPPLRLVDYFIVISCNRDTPSLPLGNASSSAHESTAPNPTPNIFNTREDEEQITLNTTENFNDDDNQSDHLTFDDENFCSSTNGRVHSLDETQLLHRLNMRVVHLPPDEDDNDNNDNNNDNNEEEDLSAEPMPSTAYISNDVDFSCNNNLLDQHCSTNMSIQEAYVCDATSSHICAHAASKDNGSTSRRKTKHASYYFSGKQIPVISDFNLMDPLIQDYNNKDSSEKRFVPIQDYDDDSSLSTTNSHESLAGYAKDSTSSSIDTAEAQTQLDPCSIPKSKPDANIRFVESYESENIRIPSAMASLYTDADSSNSFTFTPVITARYPLVDHHDQPLNSMVTQFCFPTSTSIHLSTEYRYPRLHHFVLTDDKGKKLYGTCLTVWEEYHIEEHPTLGNPSIPTHIPQTNEESLPNGENVEIYIPMSAHSDTKFYLPKAICILSSWPFLDAFGKYITSLYQMATLTNAMNIPLERYVLNICEEVPVPHPGSFEVQVKVFQSTIRFWAPPANLPIAYVALPFQVLFECLDLDNVMFVWYALTLERKILLVSTQYSLLTICAEILCSLLFPMRWNHLYVPILPRFLCPMLDAPMPYLCGITRDNFLHAVRNINDETIVVDLDRNVITMRENTPDLPPIPLRRRTKLEAVLEEVASPVFWSARGLSPTNVQILKLQKDAYTVKQLTDRAERVWTRKLKGYDQVFHRDEISDCQQESDVFSVQNSTNYVDSEKRWGIVQESFFQFFVSMLKEYRNFLSAPHQVNDRDRWKSIRTFDSGRFVNGQRSDMQPFLEEFCRTQLFDDFITRRVASHADELDMIFFDESITAKMNRSKMTLKKKKTPFLKHTKAHKRLRVFEAVSPNVEGLSIESMNELRCYPDCSSWLKTPFSYSSLPNTFTEANFGIPRAIPKLISRFDRRTIVTEKALQEKADVEKQFYPGPVSSSLEVASFTLFFITYCNTITSSLSVEMSPCEIETADHMTTAPSKADETIVGISLCDCDSLSPLFSWCDQLSLVDVSNWIWGTNDAYIDTTSSNCKEDGNNSQPEQEKMALLYSMVDTMKLRKLNIDMDVVKSLFKAAANWKNRQMVAQLFDKLHTRGIKVNQDMRTSEAINQTGDTLIDPSSSELDVLKDRTSDSFDSNRIARRSDSDNLSNSWIGRYSLSQSFTSSLGRKSLTMKDKLLKTDDVSRNLLETKHRSLDLFGELRIDSNDVCPQCSNILTEDEIMLGWIAMDFYDCTTHCPKCDHRFVACFIVTSTNPEFSGSQGKGTSLYCEFLSPWVLRWLLYSVTEQNPGSTVAVDLEWQLISDIHATIFWNLIVTFERQMIPYSFMLQA